jgi:hypothetical protein
MAVSTVQWVGVGCYCMNYARVSYEVAFARILVAVAAGESLGSGAGQIREPHRPTMCRQTRAVRKRAQHRDGMLLAAGTSGTGTDVVVFWRDGGLQDRAEDAESAHPQVPILLTPPTRTWSDGPLLDRAVIASGSHLEGGARGLVSAD